MQPNQTIYLPTNSYDTVGMPPTYPYKIPEFNPELLINSENLPKSEQYFIKPKLKKGISAEQKKEWVLRERDRIVLGCWFWNNGHLTYINGLYYFVLQYWKEDFLYSREQSEYCMFLEFCEDDKKALGYSTFKPRRAGVSSIEIMFTWWKVLLYANAKFGMMSLSNTKVKEVLFEPFLEVYDIFPSYLKPKSDKLKTSIKLSDGTEGEEVDMVGNLIKAIALSQTGFDGLKMRHITIDEVWKILNKIDTYALIETQKKCLIDKFTGKVVGKLGLISTLGEDDKLMAKAIKTAMYYWEKSNYTNLNEFGKTETKLYRYFISAVDVGMTDKYGEVNIEENIKEILHEREIKKEEFGEKSVEYITELRQTPFTIEELFTTSRKSSLFGIRPHERLHKVIKTPKNQRGYAPAMFYTDPNDGKVKLDFEEYHPDFHFLIAQHILDNNNCRKTFSGIQLPRNPEGVIGYDGIRYDVTKTGQVSSAGVVIIKALDHHSNTGSGISIPALAFGRTDTDYIDNQVMLASMYYGYPINFERQVEGTRRFLKNKNALGLCAISPYDKMEGTLKDKNVVQDAVKFYTDLLRKPRNEDEYDFIESVSFEDFLRQTCDYSPELHGKLDLMAAWFMGLVGVAGLSKTVVRHNNVFFKKLANII